ncbi:hypothetical protein [Photobacterium toruni]|uniref:hypothetical protein n=1 Tax=Photobacterium toruni TaxID=1935446 RepID=UPI00210F2AC2|nr:hypothetical protein [Photobacterium toruni]
MEISKINRLLISTTILLMVSGCSFGPNHICRPDEAISMGSAEIPVKRPGDIKVSILDVDIQNPDKAYLVLKSTMKTMLEGQVVDSGSVLVDRSLARKLKRDVQLAEQSGRYSTKGVPVANYVVVSEVTSSDLSTQFNKSRSYTDSDGDTHYTPASCDYDVDVKAVLKVLSIPDMTLVKRIEIKGNADNSKETNNSNCPVTVGRYIGLAQSAVENAVKVSRDLKELLAPNGPTLELRQCDSYNMVKVGIGSNRHIMPDTKISFIQMLRNTEGEIETFTIGKGKVVDIPRDGIKPNYSWVTVDDEIALKIRKGDKAQAEVPCITLGCQLGLD